MDEDPHGALVKGEELKRQKEKIRSEVSVDPRTVSETSARLNYGDTEVTVVREGDVMRIRETVPARPFNSTYQAVFFDVARKAMDAFHADAERARDEIDFE